MNDDVKLASNLNKWSHLGHDQGECWHDADANITFVHIPKNASSFLKGCIIATGKFVYSKEFVPAKKYLIVLRDPLERWISGISQFFITNSLPDQMSEIFDIITYDDHTDLQSYFISQVNLDTSDIFYMDKNLRSNMQDWIDRHDYSIYMPNIPDLNPGNTELKTQFESVLQMHPEYAQKVRDFFKQDYDLIRKVKFINENY
jgi:hypothetical protein